MPSKMAISASTASISISVKPRWRVRTRSLLIQLEVEVRNVVVRVELAVGTGRPDLIGVEVRVTARALRLVRGDRARLVFLRGRVRDVVGEGLRVVGEV